MKKIYSGSSKVSTMRRTLSRRKKLAEKNPLAKAFYSIKVLDWINKGSI